MNSLTYWCSDHWPSTKQRCLTSTKLNQAKPPTKLHNIDPQPTNQASPNQANHRYASRCCGLQLASQLDQAPKVQPQEGPIMDLRRCFNRRENPLGLKRPSTVCKQYVSQYCSHPSIMSYIKTGTVAGRPLSTYHDPMCSVESTDAKWWNVFHKGHMQINHPLINHNDQFTFSLSLTNVEPSIIHTKMWTVANAIVIAIVIL